jgi:AAA family ATP:ADP antiporter
MNKDQGIARWVGRVFDIRRGEWLVISLMSVYIFSVVFSYLILKTTSRAMFTHRVGAEYLPYVYIMIALIAGGIASLYRRFSGKISVYRLILLTDFFIIINLGVFWYFFGGAEKEAWLFYTFYVWVSIFGVLVPSQFWLLANHVYNPREARRLFGLLAGMAIVGGTTSGYFIKLTVHYIGTENLLFACIFFQALVSLLLVMVQRKAGLSDGRPDRAGRTPGTAKAKESILEMFREISSVKHLRLLVAIIATTVLVVQFVDYQFMSIASQHKQGDDLTAFVGLWSSNLSVVALLIQFLLAQRLLRRFGVIFAICILPFGLALGNLGLFIYATIYAAIILKVSDGAFRYSLNKSGMELLYLPIPTALKDRTKVFIDMVVDRAGRGLSGILLVLATAVLGLSVSQVSIMALLIILFWFYLIYKMRKEYINTFRASLVKQTLDPDEIRLRIHEASHVDLLLNTLESGSAGQKVLALDLLSDAKKVDFSPILTRWIRHDDSRVRSKIFKLARIIGDPILLDDLQSVLTGESDRDVYLDGLAYYQSLDEDKSLAFLKDQLEKGPLQHQLWSAQFIMSHRDRFGGLFSKDWIEARIRDRAPQRRWSGTLLLDLSGDVNMLQANKARLLSDASVDVRKAIIQALGRSGKRRFLPDLFLALTDNRMKGAAMEALIFYGDRIFGTLRDYLLDPRQKIALRRTIPSLLQNIGGQRAVDILSDAFNVEEEILRFKVLKALNKLRHRSPELKADRQKISSELQDAVVCYFHVFAAEERIKADPDFSGNDFLKQALSERRTHDLEVIFRILGLVYQPEDMLFAYQGLASGDRRRRASALEFLDNLLERKTNRMIFAVVDDMPDDRRMQLALSLPGFSWGDLDHHLDFILQGRDSWLKTCILYFAGSCRRRGFEEAAEKMAGSSERMLNEISAFYLSNLRSA